MTVHLPERDVQDALRARLGIDDARIYVWARHVPYFYCGYSNWLQHDGYVRQMEEAVERFLAFVGLPIGETLRARNWIPAVQHVRLETFVPVAMEEMLYTVVCLRRLQLGTVYEIEMDFYVLRGGQPVRSATGRVRHAYVLVNEKEEWQSRVVRMDREVEAQLVRWVTRLPRTSTSSPGRAAAS